MSMESAAAAGTPDKREQKAVTHERHHAVLRSLLREYRRYMDEDLRTGMQFYFQGLEGLTAKRIGQDIKRQIGREVPADVQERILDAYLELEIDRTRYRLASGKRMVQQHVAETIPRELIFDTREPSRVYRYVVIAETLLKEGYIKSIEEMDAFELNRHESGNISENILTQCSKIYWQNYRTNPALRDVLVENFHASSAGDRSLLYTLECEGRVIAFDRFDALGADRDGRAVIHFAAMNVAPDLHGQSLGDMLMDATLESEAKESPVMAECDLGSRVAASYINKRGFVGVAIFRDWLGITKMDMQRDPDMNAKLLTRSWSDEEALTRLGDQHETWEFRHGPAIHIVRGSPASMPEIFPSVAPEDNMVLTRIIEDGEQIVAVFEDSPDVIYREDLTVDASRRGYVDSVLALRGKNTPQSEQAVD